MYVCVLHVFVIVKHIKFNYQLWDKSGFKQLKLWYTILAFSEDSSHIFLLSQMRWEEAKRVDIQADVLIIFWLIKWRYLPKAATDSFIMLLAFFGGGVSFKVNHLFLILDTTDCMT